MQKMSENGIIMDQVPTEDHSPSLRRKSSQDDESNELLMDDDETIRKKFLFRLVAALHSAGNLSFRTETYLRDVAHAFDMQATCTVFPVSATLSFQESSNHLNAGTSDSYSIAIGNIVSLWCWFMCINNFHSEWFKLCQIEPAG
jgi:hypothetical protein